MCGPGQDCDDGWVTVELAPVYGDDGAAATDRILADVFDPATAGIWNTARELVPFDSRTVRALVVWSAPAV